jgi:hypothetical protein
LRLAWDFAVDGDLAACLPVKFKGFLSKRHLCSVGRFRDKPCPVESFVSGGGRSSE